MSWTTWRAFSRRIGRSARFLSAPAHARLRENPAYFIGLGGALVIALLAAANYSLIETAAPSIDSAVAPWESDAWVVAAIGVLASVAIAVVAALLMVRAYARIADESDANQRLKRAIERAVAISHAQHLTETALRHSERRFRDIAEFSADWIWESDADHRFTFLSGDGARPIYGRTRWEVARGDIHADPHWQRHKADLDARVAFRGFRFTARQTDGSVQHYATSGKPVFDDRGDFQGYRGTLTNETEAITAQHRAQRADRLLRDAIDSISEGFVIFDCDDKLVMCNEAFRQIHAKSAAWIAPGCSFEELLRAGIARGQYLDAQGREEEWLAERLSQHRLLDGTVEQQLDEGRWALVSERRMSDGGTAGLRVDITALKKIQAALHESEVRLDEAERIAGLGCTDYDLIGRKRTWSNQTYRIFGIDIRELPPSTHVYLDLVHPADKTRLESWWRKQVQGIACPPIDYRIIRPDGVTRLIHRESDVIRDRTGRPVRVVSTIQDITDRHASEERARQLELQLFHSQKLEALGTMAGGIAHELNNVLGPILALSKIALEDLSQEGKAKTDLAMVVEASERARDLVRQILAFGRKPDLEKRQIDLLSTTRQALRILNAALPSNIEIIERLEPVPPILADAGQLQQVIVNLITNAVQAIGAQPGRVTVSLGEHRSDDRKNALCLSVADTGSGMTKEIANRIFEPFFTTKGVQEGTGLGLSVAHGIITAHGGWIDMRSTPGQGSEFFVILPTSNVDTVAPAEDVAAA
jgi:PAS domain S-box-containing protein